MAKKTLITKQIGKRSKKKEEIQMRMKQQKDRQEKRKLNQEIFTLITPDQIQNLQKEEKLEVLNKIYTLILSYPEQNHDKIDLILVFLQDSYIDVVIKAFELITNLFVDILPEYKIRKDKEIPDKQRKSFVFSKEVEQLKGYENNLVEKYRAFIDLIDKFLKADIPNIDLDTKLHIFSQPCKLFISHPCFNYNESLLKIISNKLHCNNPEIRRKAQETLGELLMKVDNSNDYLDLKLKIINSLTHVIFNTNESKLEKDIITLLNYHKVDFPIIPKIDKKQGKVEKEIKREMKEYESGPILDHENATRIFNYNLKILKKILFVYLEFLTNKPNSKFIRQIIDQISKQAEYINVEILHDLQKCIYKYISIKLSELKDSNSSKITQHIGIINICITSLKTCIIIKEKLTSEIVSVEDSYLLNNVYFLIDKIKFIINKLDIDELYNFMELIHYSIVLNRQFSTEITCSYIKRLSITIAEIEKDSVGLAFAIMLKRIIDLYPQCNFICYDDGDDMFDSKINDPSLANGKLTNIAKELIKISKIGKNCNKLSQQIIEKSQIKNKDFVNYFEVLLKLKENK